MFTELPHIELLRISDRLAPVSNKGESQFREFKSAVDRSSNPPKGRDFKTICRDIGETLVPFANADVKEKAPRDIHAQRTTSIERRFLGKIQAMKTNGYGFIEMNHGGGMYFFHISDLLDRSNWDRMQVGDVVSFSPYEGQEGPTARQVQSASD